MQDSYEELKGFSLVHLKRQPTFQPDPSMSGLGSGRARVMSVPSSDGWLRACLVFESTRTRLQIIYIYIIS